MRRVRGQVSQPRQVAAQPHTAARRLVAVLLMLSFWIQFGRYYMPATAEPHLCPVPLPAETVAHTHGDHDHHLARDLAPPEPENGPNFDHCKEFLSGLGLFSVQPMIAEAVNVLHRAPSSSVALLPRLQPFPQADLSAPFHPPRHLV